MKEKINTLKELVENFKANIKQYKSPIYDEANTRVDYIDKFFELLDWDVRNTQGFSEQYRDVVREDKVVIEGKPKAPDYSFRIGGIRKFFVEAKKPAINIKEDIEPAFQIRRYSYTAKLPLAILTDFEEFAVYDTRIKPHKNDKASTARIFYCTYEEYEKHFEFIYNTFSKKAILKGSFDKYIEENKNKKGTSEVDQEFLKLIEWWREILARTIALRNKNIDIYNLNYAIQKIIDRLIFLRIAEDRHMETYNSLLNISNNKGIYVNLVNFFHKADNKYNSGLFKIEEWIDKIQIDEKVLFKIIHGLYYPECPYEFSVLPIEILGHIYEQFLGKTIRLTLSHQAKIEEKPDIRKAGGVYYTPQYIVDYIVENTVGEKIKNKSPKQIEKTTICDPACGSGSFLVGAYKYLLNYHHDYYIKNENLKKASKNGCLYQAGDNDFRLTIEEKQKILLNNIYGVDIDSQAVEVTKLSLLLKLLEGEVVQSQYNLFKHSDLKLLPNLSNNIKCGNSLIGNDFFLEKNLSLFDNEKIRKINTFNWQENFQTIFNQSGFDIIIGNPPYIVLSKEGYNKDIIKYLNNKFEQVTYQLDSYLLFIVQAIKISKGFVGFIIPNAYLCNLNIVKFRKWLLSQTSIKQIVTLPSNVFRKAVVDTTILIINTKYNVNNKVSILKMDNNDKQFLYNINQMNFLNDPDFKMNIYIEPHIQNIINKILHNSNKLEDYLETNRGVHAYRKDGYGKSKYSNGFQTERDYNEKSYHSNNKLDKSYKIEVRGKNIFRYYHTDMGVYISYGNWLAEPRDIKYFYQPRIYLRKIVGETLYACLSITENIPDQSVYIGILRKNINLDLKYFLGFLNSKLMVFIFRYLNNEFDKIFPQIKVTEFKNLPIFNINLEDKNLKSKHDEMVSTVNEMIITQNKYNNIKSDKEKEKEFLKRKIDILDLKIDNLIYNLYNLSDDEIKIIEETKK